MHSEKERNKPPYNSLKKYLGVNLTKGKDLLLSPRPKPPTVRSCPRTAPEGRDPAGGARAAASQPGESGGRRCLGCAPIPPRAVPTLRLWPRARLLEALRVQPRENQADVRLSELRPACGIPG